MPKKVHTEAEVISALKQYEGGDKTAGICRQLGLSQATFGCLVSIWCLFLGSTGKHERDWKDYGDFA
jgi:hypothetical protein